MKDENERGTLDLWNRFADIDPKFTKKITGKPYQGTSPSPQYVIRCLTEMFGPVGVGFGWSVTSEGFQPLGEEILHWCRIRFWHGSPENGYEAYGQTKALMNTRNGQMSDEDAPKKSLTDAIVKAASHIGIAANIFLGRWDDQKYVAGVNADYRNAEGGGDGKDRHEAAVLSALKGIATEKTMESLSEYWRDLRRNQRDVAADNRVTSAKDARKAELQNTYDLGDDEIPY